MTIRYVPADNLFEWSIGERRMLKTHNSSRLMLKSFGYSHGRTRLILALAYLAFGVDAVAIR